MIVLINYKKIIRIDLVVTEYFEAGVIGYNPKPFESLAVWVEASVNGLRPV